MAKSHFVEALEKISQASKESDLSIQQIFDLMGDKGHLILILFFSVPFLQPVPLMGLSTPLGTLVVIVSYYYLIQKPPWLPKRFCEVKVSKVILFKTVETIRKIWSYLEKILHPRLAVLHDSKAFRFINFVVVAVSAVLLALPLPIPFSNTIPTIPLVLNAVGQLEEDGIIILMSLIGFLISLTFFVGLGAGLFVGISENYDKIIPLLGF